MIVARSSPTTSRKRPRRGPTFKRAPACYFCAPFVFITLQIPLPDCPSATAFIFMNLQIPFPANPLFAHVYKTPGVSPTGKAHSGPFWNGQQNVVEQKENAPECNSGARQMMKRRNNVLRYRCGGFGAGVVAGRCVGLAAGVVAAGAPAFAGYA